VSDLVITPAPTDEEAAAIVAAHEALWPRPVAVTADGDRSPAWRFSGRWWMPAARPPRTSGPRY